MKPRVSIAIAALFAMSGISSATWAADKTGLGKQEYQSNCASCQAMTARVVPMFELPQGHAARPEPVGEEEWWRLSAGAGL